jgi:hypothetical protein
LPQITVVSELGSDSESIRNTVAFTILSIEGTSTCGGSGDSGDALVYIPPQGGNAACFEEAGFDGFGSYEKTFLNQCDTRDVHNSILKYTIPRGIARNEDTTLTFDFSQVRIENKGNILESDDPKKCLQNGGGYVWEHPFFLEEVEDTSAYCVSLNLEGTTVEIKLTLKKEGSGYKGLIRVGEGTHADLEINSQREIEKFETANNDANESRISGLKWENIEIGIGNGGDNDDEDSDKKTFALDLSQLRIIDSHNVGISQAIGGSTASGRGPQGEPTSFFVDERGILTGLFEDGSVKPLYQLALVTCPDPTKMEERSGGFYVPTPESGPLKTGTSGSHGFGTVVSGALEASTTDISKELASAIETQTHYAANAQVISTISQMLDALMQLSKENLETPFSSSCPPPA